MQSIQEAVRLNLELDRLFAQVGSAAHPRGRILSAYRLALRALRADSSVSGVRETMRVLRLQVQRDARDLLVDAARLGGQSAVTQAGFYGEKVPPPPVDLHKVEAQATVIADQVQAQASAAVGVAVMEREEELIFGTDSTAGVVRPGPVVSGTNLGMASLMGFAMGAVFDTVQDVGFMKQAIAALDSRTTDCCLRVHGQVQELDGLFHLTGEPRFADDLDWSPFHWNCRTSIALYKPEFDDGLTDRMKSGAKTVISERRKGNEPDQSPADAFFGEG